MDHPLHCYIVLIAMSLMGLALLIQGYRLSRQGQHFLGAVAIPKAWFITGKLSLFTSWVLLLAKAVDPSMDWFAVFPQLPWTALIFLIPGVLIMSVSFYHLGVSLKVGLPHQETVLKTRGLYSFSRNPLYLGVYLITIASVLYFPDIVNIILCVTGIILHHLITLSEEKFLSSRFGSSYEDYKNKVRRYI
ncbi:MAG: isoprenylcysteine carboxylmethyltransferase family protein [Bacteroidetes bacterium]|nr:isoprenylcysteine carboxylmethyltransferase family protein [Bacteroidota bacterium]